MARATHFHDRRGGIALILVLIAVLTLGLLGIAGSAGASSFSSASEMVLGEHAARRLARMALDEAQGQLRQQADENVSAIHDDLRQARVEGVPFSPKTYDLPVDRTAQIAAEELGREPEIRVTARFFQHNPFGVFASKKVHGGDQTYGNLVLEARVRLPPAVTGLFARRREVMVRRIVGFRATTPEPAAPFDQAALWVKAPKFLTNEVKRIRDLAQSACPQLAMAGLPNPEDLFRDAFLYSKFDKQVVETADLTLQTVPSDCTGAKQSVEEFLGRFQWTEQPQVPDKTQFRFVDAKVRSRMDQFYWPQLATASFLGDLGRADHVFSSQKELMEYLTRNGGQTVHLNGIYYVQKAVTIDLRFSGRGCIVSPETIRVLRATKADAGATLTLVSTDAQIDLTDANGQVAAALIAPHGTVRGLANRQILGLLVAAELSEGFEAGTQTRIEHDQALITHPTGKMAVNPDRLEIHFDDVPLAQF